MISKTSLLKHSDKDFYFRNVYVFINKVKKLTIIKNNKQVKKNYNLIYEKQL